MSMRAAMLCCRLAVRAARGGLCGVASTYRVGKEQAGATPSSHMDARSQTSAFVNVFYVLC